MLNFELLSSLEEKKIEGLSGLFSLTISTLNFFYLLNPLNWSRMNRRSIWILTFHFSVH